MLWNFLTLTCIDIGLALTFNYDFTVKMPDIKLGILITVLTHNYTIYTYTRKKWNLFYRHSGDS